MLRTYRQFVTLLLLLKQYPMEKICREEQKMKGKTIKKVLLAMMTAVLLCGAVPETAVPFAAETVEAASKPKTSVTVTCGKSSSIAVSSAVKYTSANKSVATVSSKGLVIGKKKGKTTVTIKTKSKTYKTKVTVVKEKASIDINTKSIKLATGEKVSLKASSKVRLTYKAKNKNIKVDSKGNVTGVKKGTSSVVITGKSTKYFSAPKSVTVKVTVTDPTITVQYGKTGSVKKKNASKYTSSNTGIVKVDKNGKLTPVKAGTTTVSVKVGKTTKKYTVVVKKADSTIKIAKTAVEVQVGKTLELKASGKSTLSYKADNANITVDKNGKITGKKAGTATVTITGKSTSCYNAPKTVKVKVTVKAAASSLPSTDPESCMTVYTGPKTPESFLRVCNNLATMIAKDGNWIYSNRNNKKSLADARANSRTTNCAHFVSLCMQQFGTIPQGYTFYSYTDGELKFQPLHLPAEKVIMESLNKYYTIIKPNGKKVSQLNLQPGDVCCYKGHVNVYAGKNSKGVMTWYDFAASGTSDGKKDSGYFVRILKTGNSSSQVYTIFRLK